MNAALGDAIPNACSYDIFSERHRSEGIVSAAVMEGHSALACGYPRPNS